MWLKNLFSFEWNQSDYGGKDLWKRWVFSLEWNVEAVIGGENEGGDCDEQDEVNQEESEQTVEVLEPVNQFYVATYMLIWRHETETPRCVHH